jgi:heterogeneous nuclear ribonucleoprotein A1/A3
MSVEETKQQQELNQPQNGSAEVNGNTGYTNGVHHEDHQNGHHENVSATNGEALNEPEHYRKIFVGSLSYGTADEAFRSYFGKYGTILDCVIMKDNKTQKSRGFGFVTYDKLSCVDACMKERPHKLDGRELEIKRATPREDSGKPGAEQSTCKLFVGAVKEGLTEDNLREYFGKYGKIEDCVIMKDKETQKLRGFAFVTFDDYDPVDRIVLEKFHTVAGQSLAVKKAQPKTAENSNGFQNNQRGRNGGYINNRSNGHGPNSLFGSFNGQGGSNGLMDMPHGTNMNQFTMFAQKMFEAMGNGQVPPANLFPNGSGQNGFNGNNRKGNLNNNNRRGGAPNGGQPNNQMNFNDFTSTEGFTGNSHILVFFN